MKPQNKILPAIIADNQQQLDQMLKLVPFAPYIMLDLMDGNFVQAKSLDFPMKIPRGPEYQLHIMAADPIERLKTLPKNIDTAILHAETLGNISAAIDEATKRRVKLFIALNPETSIKVVEPYLNKIDGVLVMTVHPGQYGAKFLPEQLEKARILRRLKPDLEIEVDGGMNDKTIPLALEAGANQFASGSYIMKNPSPEQAYRRLIDLAS